MSPFSVKDMKTDFLAEVFVRSHGRPVSAAEPGGLA
jgi:hypothetical protein